MLPSTGFPTFKWYTPDAGQHFVIKRFIICPEEAEARAVQSETLIPVGVRDLLYSKTSQTGFGAQPAAYSIGTRGSVAWIKQPGRDVGHSPSSSAEVKKKWSYTSTSSISPHGVWTQATPLYFNCTIFTVRSLRRTDHSSGGVLPTVARRCV